MLFDDVENAPLCIVRVDDEMERRLDEAGKRSLTDTFFHA